jgi:dienelactone hydrolase
VRTRAARLAGVLVALAAACGGGGEDTSRSSTPTTAEPSSTTTTIGVVDGRPYPVARDDVVIEDATRPTAASWARNGSYAGYVVVAPTFPLSSGEGGEIFDYVNQPGDVYAALDATIERLGDLVDADRIALAGHSLGAMTTIGAALNSCCADRRVDAAIAVAGIEAPFPDGDFEPLPPTPLLLVHGDADRTIDVDGSENLFAKATGPVAFLRHLGGGHSDVFVGDAGEVTAAAFLAWLDQWLLDDAAGLRALPDVVEESGAATLTTRDIPA